MTRILFSNDDGVHAKGLHILAKEFTDAKWDIVAPEKERSTTGHSLTLHKPLRLHKFHKHIFSVSGGPADCIYLGISEVVKGKPDIVISGINKGANLGQDVFYSGTVSAAREAANLGIPAMAVSLNLDFHKKDKVEHYESAAKAAKLVLKQVLQFWGDGSEKKGFKVWPKGLVLNVNVPNLPWKKIKGLRVASQGQRFYGGKIVKRTDARGRKYYWIGGSYQGFNEKLKDSDCAWVHKGYVAITPLELDTTMLPVYHALIPAFEYKKR